MNSYDLGLKTRLAGIARDPAASNDSVATESLPNPPPAKSAPTVPDMNAYDLELKKRLTRIAQDPAEMNKYLSDVTTMLRIYRERNKVSELYPDEMTKIFGRALEHRIANPITQDNMTYSKLMWLQGKHPGAVSYEEGPMGSIYPIYPRPSNGVINGQSSIGPANSNGNNVQETSSQPVGDGVGVVDNGTEREQEPPAEFVGGNFTMLKHNPESREAKNAMANILSGGTMYTINTEAGANQAFVAANKVIIQESGDTKIIVSSTESIEHRLDEPVRPKAVVEAINAGEKVVYHPDADGGVWTIETDEDMTYIGSEGKLMDRETGETRVFNSLEYTATHKPFYRQGEKAAATEGYGENLTQAGTIGSRHQIRVKEQFVFDAGITDRLKASGNRFNMKSGEILSIIAHAEPAYRGMLIDFMVVNDTVAGELRESFRVKYSTNDLMVLSQLTRRSVKTIATMSNQPGQEQELAKLLDSPEAKNVKPGQYDPKMMRANIIAAIRLFDAERVNLGLASFTEHEITAFAASVAGAFDGLLPDLEIGSAERGLNVYGKALDELGNRGDLDNSGIVEVLTRYEKFIGPEKYYELMKSSNMYEDTLTVFRQAHERYQEDYKEALGKRDMVRDTWDFPRPNTGNKVLDNLGSYLFRDVPMQLLEGGILSLIKKSTFATNALSFLSSYNSYREHRNSLVWDQKMKPGEATLMALADVFGDQVWSYAKDYAKSGVTDLFNDEKNTVGVKSITTTRPRQ